MNICKRCGRFGNASHACPPIWNLRFGEDRYNEYGWTEEDAIESFAHRHNLEDGVVEVLYPAGFWRQFRIVRSEKKSIEFTVEEVT